MGFSVLLPNTAYKEMIIKINLQVYKRPMLTNRQTDKRTNETAWDEHINIEMN